ncbi:glycosyltransferase [Streptomyces sp. NPDC018031]|uniref:glycosyltransferase n=1 Tax=Streptomyces sp. NPDC018031 TaxID=3365033 RepID=UPI0037A5899C
MKIAFLIWNAYGIGGTIRSTVNLSRALSAHHQVEIVSVYRPVDRPQLDLADGVGLLPLIDWRPESPGHDGDDPAAGQPSTMYPDTGVSFGPMAPSRLTDDRIASFLDRTDADVVIATRPILNGYLARYGGDRLIRIGQEHLTFNSHTPQLRTDQNTALAELDAFVTVSQADAEVYRTALPEVTTRILCIPNGVPAPAVEPSGNTAKLIVAAGRLVQIKRYDRLIDAFAKVAADRPDWNLRIYGRGVQKAALRERIDRLGLYNRIQLMGAVSPIETEWAKGSIAAVSSDGESFGMTIVEAMHCGVPVVATDCPYGPGEIITNGQDGLLVPLDGGVDAYAAALLRMIDDRDARLRMAARARTTAAAYDPAVIAERYEALIHELRSARPKSPAPPLLRRVRSGLRRVLPRAEQPRPAAEAAEQAPEAPKRVHAHCRSTSEGGVTVRLRTAELAQGQLDFVARLRRDPEKREVRLPLPAADGPLTEVTLDRTAHLLPEGRWDCYVAPGGTHRRTRLTAELVEQARLLTTGPAVGDRGVTALVPYTTADGFLALRTWLRPAHAEVAEVLVGEDSVTVTAALYGAAALGPGAEVVAMSRQGDDQHLRVPVRPVSGAGTPAGGGGPARFEFVLRYESALARRTEVEQDLWDLRLIGSPGAAAVPIGRIAGDLADRKKTDVYPACVLDHPRRGATRVRPFFNAANNLTLSARDHRPDGAGAGTGSG